MVYDWSSATIEMLIGFGLGCGAGYGFAVKIILVQFKNHAENVLERAEAHCREEKDLMAKNFEQAIIHSNEQRQMLESYNKKLEVRVAKLEKIIMSEMPGYTIDNE